MGAVAPPEPTHVNYWMRDDDDDDDGCDWAGDNDDDGGDLAGRIQICLLACLVVSNISKWYIQGIYFLLKKNQLGKKAQKCIENKDTEKSYHKYL